MLQAKHRRGVGDRRGVNLFVSAMRINDSRITISILTCMHPSLLLDNPARWKGAKSENGRLLVTKILAVSTVASSRSQATHRDVLLHRPLVLLCRLPVPLRQPLVLLRYLMHDLLLFVGTLLLPVHPPPRLLRMPTEPPLQVPSEQALWLRVRTLRRPQLVLLVVRWAPLRLSQLWFLPAGPLHQLIKALLLLRRNVHTSLMRVRIQSRSRRQSIRARKHCRHPRRRRRFAHGSALRTVKRIQMKMGGRFPTKAAAVSTSQ
jgi:hypothetical protein